MRPTTLAAFASLAAACNLTSSRNSPTQSPSQQASSGASSQPDAGSTSGDEEVRALVTEALTPQLCPRLLGSFLGLPGEGTAEGPAAGTLPSAGRWWIRQCSARVVDGRMELSLGGNGWLWVDRQSDGFRVRQYLLFDASAAFSADVTVGYDRERRVASLWMTPRNGVSASITPRGTVSASPTGFFSRLLGGVAAVTGTSVDERARQQAGELGSRQLRERLGVGFTMTVALDSHQVDFMVGALRRGQVPERPFPAGPSGPWIVNQRSTVWPGGLDVVGPFEPVTDGRLGLDIVLEEGDGAVVSAVCADTLGRYLDARFRDPSATPEPPRGTPVIELSPGQPAQHVAVPFDAPGATDARGCRVALLMSPRANSGLAARLRYRVAPDAAGASTAQSPRRVRIQVIGATVRATNASGQQWDVIGGEADLTVVTASVPLRREVDRSPVIADRNDARWSRWLPGAWELGRDLPLRFTVFDDDTTTRELIGSADLEPGAVPAEAGEVSLPLRSQGAVPVQTGVLRLRVEPSQ